jgi:hypothetical protein
MATSTPCVLHWPFFVSLTTDEKVSWRQGHPLALTLINWDLKIISFWFVNFCYRILPAAFQLLWTVTPLRNRIYIKTACDVLLCWIVLKLGAGCNTDFSPQPSGL